MNPSFRVPFATRVLGKVTATLLWCGLACTSDAAPASGYIGLYGGGPLYQQAARSVAELRQSGFSELIVWSVQVHANGDLNLNGEFALTSGGAYVGQATWPNFAADLAAMKQGSIRRITLSVGSSNANPSDFDHVKALIQAQGTGPDSTLYRAFQSLKQALPAVDAIDFDDESTYDADTMTRFGLMLGELGYHVTMSPYQNATFWTSVVAQINARRPGTVDGVHLQAYSGGAGNSPCSGWDFGGVPVFPGLWDTHHSPAQVQSQMRTWAAGCGITGGFLWLYDDIAGKTTHGQSAAQAYATAISRGVSRPARAGKVPVTSPNPPKAQQP